MNKRLSSLLILGLMIIIFSCHKPNTISWSLMLKQPGKDDIELVKIPDISKPFKFQNITDGIQVNFSLDPKKNYTVFKAAASSENTEARMYFSLIGKYNEPAIPFNFNGEVTQSEIYRQSPHDIDAWIVKKIAEQAVPMVALKGDSSFIVALCGSPALYNNFTSQVFDMKKRTIELSSGDNGETPGLKPDTGNLKVDYNTDKTQVMAPGRVLAYYPKISKDSPHIFQGIVFKTGSRNLNGLRKSVNQFAGEYFSDGRYTDYFGTLAFTTAYMNLRINETSKSKFWVVPSVEYGNTQYGRDAFWISTMLSPEYSTECLKNELAEVNTYAEYPLFAIIWAYRAIKDKTVVDLNKVQAYVNSVETRVRNGYFYSYTEKDGRMDFQYWGDVIAFEKNDVITYNQGLYALAIAMAKDLGLKVKTDPELALKNYRGMYNQELSFYPISMKKNMILGPDPLVPDLLSMIYFNKPMLDDNTVNQHYNKLIKNSKTRYGFKVVSLPNGDYLPEKLYDVHNYISQVNREKMPDGQYFRGGSYFLYDNLLLIDAYLHGVKGAEEELIARTSLDFAIGGTTFECLNTKTGEPWKPNMGWNVGIYSIWRKLMDEHKADNKLFKKIDSIAAMN
jgi:hypothetical protein